MTTSSGELAPSQRGPSTAAGRDHRRCPADDERQPSCHRALLSVCGEQTQMNTARNNTREAPVERREWPGMKGVEDPERQNNHKIVKSGRGLTKTPGHSTKHLTPQVTGRGEVGVANQERPPTAPVDQVRMTRGQWPVPWSTRDLH
jgi:hypothetical protein